MCHLALGVIERHVSDTDTVIFIKECCFEMIAIKDKHMQCVSFDGLKLCLHSIALQGSRTQAYS